MVHHPETSVFTWIAQLQISKRNSEGSESITDGSVHAVACPMTEEHLEDGDTTYFAAWLLDVIRARFADLASRCTGLLAVQRRLILQWELLVTSCHDCLELL